MNKEQLTPLSGFRDNTSLVRDWVMATVREIYQSYGYQPLETPALERQEILLGKLGEEGQKQLYLFEDNGGRKVGLRYDLTVPLSRFVALNLGSLPLPYRRYEIGTSWRAEKPQKGRYRQFVQADVDIVGAPEPESEQELVRIARDVVEKLSLEKLVFIVNDRRIVNGLFEFLKIPAEQRGVVLQLLDKRDKLTEEEFSAQFQQLSLSPVERRQILAYFLADEKEALELVERDLGVTSTESIRKLLGEAKRVGLPAKFSPAVVRGIDYYTGVVFECVAEDYPRSLGAGGRYDSLVENLAGVKIPAVGLSFGIDNIADYLEGKVLIGRGIFVVRLPETSEQIDSWAEVLRRRGRRVEVFLTDQVELGKQIKYADRRGYPEVVIPFKNEWQEKKVVVKNLQTGEQREVMRDEVGEG